MKNNSEQLNEIKKEKEKKINQKVRKKPKQKQMINKKCQKLIVDKIKLLNS